MIRKATPRDSKMVAPLIYLASGEVIRKFLAEDFTESYAIELIEQLFCLESIFISYQNVLVYEEDEQILAAAIAYPYHLINTFDATLEQWMKTSGFQESSIFSHAEANSDEFYIDSIAVLPSAQGRGLSTLLMDAIETEARSIGMHKLSLIVDVNKTKAKQIYEKRGFIDDDIRHLYDNQYFHMIKIID